MRDPQEYLRYLVTLTAVLDPFLAIPIFVGVTATRGEAATRRLANVVTVTVFLVLAGAALFGESLLKTMGASLPALLWATLRIAHAAGERMGTTGLNIATRLLGLILAAIAIETMADGLKQLFPGLA